MDKLPEFIGNHTMLFAAAAFIFGLIIINEWRIRTRGFNLVHAVQAVAGINAGAQILDVRSDKQFKAGRILNAVHVPQDRLDQVEKSLKDKTQAIIVVCDTGHMSPRAADKLVKLGYKNVSILQGGIKTWQQENLPLAT